MGVGSGFAVAVLETSFSHRRMLWKEAIGDRRLGSEVDRMTFPGGGHSDRRDESQSYNCSNFC